MSVTSHLWWIFVLFLGSCYSKELSLKTQILLPALPWLWPVAWLSLFTALSLAGNRRRRQISWGSMQKDDNGAGMWLKCSILRQQFYYGVRCRTLMNFADGGGRLLRKFVEASSSYASRPPKAHILLSCLKVICGMVEDPNLLGPSWNFLVQGCLLSLPTLCLHTQNYLPAPIPFVGKVSGLLHLLLLFPREPLKHWKSMHCGARPSG